MGPYSLDLRLKVLAAYDRHEGSIRELAERFDIAKDTLRLWLKLRRETGSAQPRPMGGFRWSRMTPEACSQLETLLEEGNDQTHEQLAEAMAQSFGLLVHPHTVGRALQRLHITRKKKRSGLRRR